MELSRRIFLRTAAPASLLFRLAGPKPALKAAAPNDQIGMGFIGVGIRGSYLLEGFRKTPGVRALIAADCYDGHLAWAREATGGAIETTRDYFEILKRPDIDAVVIATPDHWHARMILDALAAGKHVYVEKPMTYSIEEGKQVVEAVRKSGKTLMVGSQGKTSTLTAKARELVKSGILGDLNQCRLATNRNSPEGAWVYPVPDDASPQTIDWNRWLGPAPKIPFDARRVFRWRCWWEYSGGVATDLWVHSFTTFHEVMDVKGPRSAVAQGGIFRFPDGRTCPDLLTGIYEYPNFILEITANLGSSRSSGGFVIAGSQASLSLGARAVEVSFEPPPGPVAWYGLNGWTQAAREKYLASLGFEGGKRPPRQEAKPPEVHKVERGLEHHELFVKCLREGSPSPENAEEGHFAAGAAHLGNMAFRQRRRLEWNLASNKVS